MTLKEHITHCKWYAQVSSFREKMPDGLSDNLWREMIEVFCLWHVYSPDEPELVEFHLMEMHAREYLSV